MAIAAYSLVPSKVMVFTVSQLSLVEGWLILASYSHKPGAEKVTSAGQVTPGSSVSSTVTSKLQEVVLPVQSSASYVTVVVPTGKAPPVEPEQVRVEWLIFHGAVLCFCMSS